MHRREQMRACLARRDREGLTFRELSAEVDVPVGTLAFWAWKLRHEAARDSASSANSDARFVEVIVARDQSASRLPDSRLEVVLVHGRRIVVTGAFDAEQLTRVVQVLERC